LRCRDSPPATIPAGKKWDTNTCSVVCITDNSGIPKDGYAWNKETCIYDCTRICTSPYVLEASNCQCKCGLTDTQCRSPHKVDSACQCTCPNNMQEPPTYDKTIKLWDTNDCVLKCKNDMSGTPKDGYTWNPNTCAYDCTRICTYPFELEKSSCTCKCSLTDESCLLATVVNDECKCVCPSNMQEPTSYDKSIKYWDSFDCVLKCFKQQPAVFQPGKHWDENTCEEVCIKVLACRGTQQYMTDTCECRCNPSKPANFPDYKDWDDINCVGTCKASQTPCLYPEHTWSTDLCKCSCPNEPTTVCPAGSIFSPKRGCKCVESCNAQPPAEGCDYEQKWYKETCQCECIEEEIPHGYQCTHPLKSWDNSSCACNCKDKNPDCDWDHFTFDDDTCQCICDGSEPAEGCTAVNTKYTWFKQFCDCRCSNFLTERPNCEDPYGPRRWNAESCRCECKKPPICDSTKFTTNSNTCTCDCIAQPSVEGCAARLSWSRSECKCA
jgi:hypothetical protein